MSVLSRRRRLGGWARADDGGSRATVGLLVSALVIGTGVYLVSPASANPGPLSGSTFAADDGNLVLAPSDTKDWENASINCADTTSNDRTCAIDESRSQTDDSFGQGTKEDTPVPTPVTGSIPNNKSDLTRFYVTHDKGTVSGATHDFVYVAWERANVLGTANMGFEFNQVRTDSGNGVTPQRTAGDVLITFDWASGGNQVNLGLLRWLTAPTSGKQCFSASAPPCWGGPTPNGIVDLVAANAAIGQVNASGDVYDPIADVTLPAKTFGEAAIDLTAAGVFQAGVCAALGSGYLKSRSSDSFTSAVKDFIAPVPVSISNCGSVTFYKQDDLASSLGGAWFVLQQSGVAYAKSTTLNGAKASGVTQVTVADGSFLPSAGAFKVKLGYGTADVEEVTVSSRSGETLTLAAATTKAHADGVAVRWEGTCSPSGTTATCTIPNLPYGTYTLHETSAPNGYTAAADQNFTISSGSSTATLTFVDNRAPIDLLINKKDDAGTPNAITICDPPKTSATNCAAFALYQDNTPTGTAIANFQPVTLPASPTSTTLSAAITTATQTSVDVTDATGFTVGKYAEISDGVNTEDVAITAVSSNTLTVTRGVNGTVAVATFAAGSAVKLMSGNDPIVKYCLKTVNAGQCKIATVYPGSYWVDEFKVPDGYGKASGLPQAVTVNVADTSPRVLSPDGTATYFTDPRLFKVITLVCIKSSNQLYSSTVTYDSGSGQSSLAHNATLPSGIASEAALCSLGGATHDNVQYGSHSASISIPQN